MWSCNQSSSFRSEIYTFCRLHSNPRAQLGIFRTLKLWSQSPMYDTRLLASYMMWSQSPIYDTRLIYMALKRKTEHPFSFLRRPEKLCQTMKRPIWCLGGLSPYCTSFWIWCTVQNTFLMQQTLSACIKHFWYVSVQCCTRKELILHPCFWCKHQTVWLCIRQFCTSWCPTRSMLYLDFCF